MVTSCCAYGCTERYVAGSGITFHTFPKDEILKKIWEAKIRRKGFVAAKYSRLCSKHFAKDCFVELSCGAMVLKPDSIPTIFNFLPNLKSKRKKLADNQDPVTSENNGCSVHVKMDNQNGGSEVSRFSLDGVIAELIIEVDDNSENVESCENVMNFEKASQSASCSSNNNSAVLSKNSPRIQQEIKKSFDQKNAAVEIVRLDTFSSGKKRVPSLANKPNLSIVNSKINNESIRDNTKRIKEIDEGDGLVVLEKISETANRPVHTGDSKESTDVAASSAEVPGKPTLSRVVSMKEILIKSYKYRQEMKKRKAFDLVAHSAERLTRSKVKKDENSSEQEDKRGEKEKRKANAVAPQEGKKAVKRMRGRPPGVPSKSTLNARSETNYETQLNGNFCDLIQSMEKLDQKLLYRIVYYQRPPVEIDDVTCQLMQFSGFSFSELSTEYAKRQQMLKSLTETALSRFCNILGVDKGTKEEMIENILSFLVKPPGCANPKPVKFVIEKSMQPIVVLERLSMDSYTLKSKELPSDGEDSDLSSSENTPLTRLKRKNANKERNHKSKDTSLKEETGELKLKEKPAMEIETVSLKSVKNLLEVEKKSKAVRNKMKNKRKLRKLKRALRKLRENIRKDTAEIGDELEATASEKMPETDVQKEGISNEDKALSETNGTKSSKQEEDSLQETLEDSLVGESESSESTTSVENTSVTKSEMDIHDVKNNPVQNGEMTKVKKDVKSKYDKWIKKKLRARREKLKKKAEEESKVQNQHSVVEPVPAQSVSKKPKSSGKRRKKSKGRSKTACADELASKESASNDWVQETLLSELQYVDKDMGSDLALHASSVSKNEPSIENKTPKKGKKLELFPSIKESIESASHSVIQRLHVLLYGGVNKPESLNELKANILNFNGFDFVPSSEKWNQKKFLLSLLSMNMLREYAEILHISSIDDNRYTLINSLMAFLTTPDEHLIDSSSSPEPPAKKTKIEKSSPAAPNAPANQVKKNMKSQNDKEKKPGPRHRKVLMSDEEVKKMELALARELRAKKREEASWCNSYGIPIPQKVFTYTTPCAFQNPGVVERIPEPYETTKFDQNPHVKFMIVTLGYPDLEILHFLVFLLHAAKSRIRRNLLEFGGFCFDENSLKYRLRTTMLKGLNYDIIKRIGFILGLNMLSSKTPQSTMVNNIMEFLHSPCRTKQIPIKLFPQNFFQDYPKDYNIDAIFAKWNELLKSNSSSPRKSDNASKVAHNLENFSSSGSVPGIPIAEVIIRDPVKISSSVSSSTTETASENGDSDDDCIEICSIKGKESEDLSKLKKVTYLQKPLKTQAQNVQKLPPSSSSSVSVTSSSNVKYTQVLTTMASSNSTVTYSNTASIPESKKVIKLVPISSPFLMQSSTNKDIVYVKMPQNIIPSATFAGQAPNTIAATNSCENTSVASPSASLNTVSTALNSVATAFPASGVSEPRLYILNAQHQIIGTLHSAKSLNIQPQAQSFSPTNNVSSPSVNTIRQNPVTVVSETKNPVLIIKNKNVAGGYSVSGTVQPNTLVFPSPNRVVTGPVLINTLQPRSVLIGQPQVSCTNLLQDAKIQNEKQERNASNSFTIQNLNTVNLQNLPQNILNSKISSSVNSTDK